jgi:hypothetical protein
MGYAWDVKLEEVRTHTPHNWHVEPTPTTTSTRP